MQLLELDLLDVMLHSDQLNMQREIGAVFNGFDEAPIRFRPTFKVVDLLRDCANSSYSVQYDRNTDDFDTSAKCRVPAWTDRILFKSKREDSVACRHYNSVPTMKQSDHR